MAVSEGATSSLTTPQSFTEKANYMSLTGFKRWQHYQKTGVWETVTSVEKESMGGSNFVDEPESIEILRFLQEMIKRKPFAHKYVFYWTFHMSAFNTEADIDYFYEYRADERKFNRGGLNGATFPLDDELLDALVLRWDATYASNQLKRQEARTQFETLYGPMTKESWGEWWTRQK
jgi:hypothetical protein